MPAYKKHNQVAYDKSAGWWGSQEHRQEHARRHWAFADSFPTPCLSSATSDQAELLTGELHSA